MPRKKVPADQRQRSVIACVPCKKAKIRCDAKTPCTTCTRRGREHACTYEDTSNASNTRRRHSVLSSDANNGRTSGASVIESTGHATSTSQHTSPISPLEETSGPQSRMLLSSRLQKVYVGETASLSYLQFLRQIVRQRVGECAFTDGDFNNFMLENEIPSFESDPLETLPTSEKQALAQVYLDATCGILGFLDRTAIFSALHNSESANDTAALYFVMAIGAQCRGASPLDLQRAPHFFSSGQKTAFAGMLYNPSLEMVQNFLHMAFYMLGACHRNAAFMYLGVASQAAGALGLHRPDQFQNLATDECQARSATWMSLRVLATLVNSILGRSCSLPGMLRPSDQVNVAFYSTPLDRNNIRIRCLQSIFEICPFMDELETKHCKQDAEAAENFLKRLQSWSKSLPGEIRTATDTNALQPSTDREKSIGRMHVACVYYFAVILVTRRFLTIYLLDCMQNRTASQKSVLDERTTSLAYVCLDGAVNLAKVGHMTMASDHMLSSMCLVKAWMFAAGLLLGFASFVQDPNLGSEIGQAFDQSKLVLQKLAELSILAGHYFEILSSLSDAVALYEQMLASERKRKTSQYLDRVFTVGTTPSSNEAAPAFPQTAISDESPSAYDLTGKGQMKAQPEFAMDDLGMPSLDTTLHQDFPWPADDFLFDWQGFEGFPDEAFSLPGLG